MIVDKVRNLELNNLAALFDLETIEEEIYLTGSRFFGNDAEQSDWDFFCKDNQAIRERLTMLGWKYVITEPGVAVNYKNDPNCNEVMIKGNVHIQLIKSVEKKLKIQETFKWFLGSKEVSEKGKYFQQRFWKSCWNLLEKVNNEKVNDEEYLESALNEDLRWNLYYK